MTIRLYDTTGSYPSLSKGSTTLYNFYPYPEIRWSYNPSIENDDIPMQFLPEAWHNFSQTREITITGFLIETNASQPPGTKYLYQRMEELDAVCGYMNNNTWSAQPTENTSPTVYCLSIDSVWGNNYEKLAYVVPVSLEFGLGGGQNWLSYTLKLRECGAITLL